MKPYTIALTTLLLTTSCAYKTGTNQFFNQTVSEDEQVIALGDAALQDGQQIGTNTYQLECPHTRTTVIDRNQNKAFDSGDILEFRAKKFYGAKRNTFFTMGPNNQLTLDAPYKNNKTNHQIRKRQGLVRNAYMIFRTK